MIRAYKGKMPRIAASAYIDAEATIIGDVEIGEDSSVWPCTVIRGDVHWIRIGRRSNVQDGCVLHGMLNEWPVELGDNVTVGHGVILHGCVIESRVLVGMGCIIMNGARIGTGSIIAAGALIPEGAIVPPGSLFMGHPGRLRRELTQDDQTGIDGYAERYVGYKNAYIAEAGKQP
jgi:carbonic anhydrase/acetyltransferase-like protein (isoleucine patch superfamily)